MCYSASSQNGLRIWGCVCSRDHILTLHFLFNVLLGLRANRLLWFSPYSEEHSVPSLKIGLGSGVPDVFSGDRHRAGEQDGPAGAPSGGPGGGAAVGARREGEAVGGERHRTQLPHRTLHPADQPPHAASEQVCLPSAGAQKQRHPVQRHLKLWRSPRSPALLSAGCIHLILD